MVGAVVGMLDGFGLALTLCDVRHEARRCYEHGDVKMKKVIMVDRSQKDMF